jgi:CHAD domain-containing protein
MRSRGVSIQRALREITIYTGKARDFDVFREFMEMYRENRSDMVEGLAGLEMILESIHDGLTDKVVKYLGDSDYRKVKKDLLTFIGNLNAERSIFIKQNLFMIVPEQLQHCFRNVYFGHEEVWNGSLDPVLLHEFRKTCKRLRYTAEFLSPTFDNILEPLLGYFKQLQDVLGEIHDYSVWTYELSRIASNASELSVLVTISDLKKYIEEHMESAKLRFVKMRNERLNKDRIRGLIKEVTSRC